MANEEQLAILRQGVEVWNKWRLENPSIRINLIGADLTKVNIGKHPLVPDVIKKKFNGSWIKKLLFVFLLGGLQGFVGCDAVEGTEGSALRARH